MDNVASLDPDGSELRQQEQFVEFRLGDQEYAVSIHKVQEIVVPDRITELPHAEAHVEGVSTLRGTIIPIVNLQALLGRSTSAGDMAKYAVVMNIGPKTVGFLVDDVTQVLRFSSASVQSTPEMIAEQYIAGIVKVEDRIVVVLDVDELLAPENMGAAYSL